MRTSLKTALALLVAVVLGCTTANAQFRFGIKAGINLNNLNLENIQDNFTDENGCGFTGGVMTEFQVPIVGLCLDASLMYTHMSAAYDKENAPDKLKPNKDFLEVPINIKYKLGIIPVVHPYIFTGPSFAFKLGGDDDVFTTKTFQCAWNVGVGVELASHFQISGSYGFGMNNIVDKLNIDEVNVSNDFKLKNNYWTITAAYLF